MVKEAFRNNAVALLTAPYTAASGILEVDTVARFPDDGEPYRVTLGNPEKTVLLVNTNNGDVTWNVTAESDDADADTGATVTHTITAGSFKAIKKDQVSRASFFTNGEFGQFPYEEGIIHLFTDTPFLGRDKGTGSAPAVDLYYGLTRTGFIKSGNFTALNTGTAVHSTSGGITEFRTIGDSPPQGIRGRYKSVPSAPFVRRVGLIAAPPSSGKTRAGLFFRESGTNKIITLSLRSDSVDGFCVGEIVYWDSVTAINTISFQQPRSLACPFPIWFKGERAGSNLILAVSKDGYFYEILQNVALTTFFTTEPDQGGYFALNDTEIDDFRVTYVGWEEV